MSRDSRFLRLGALGRRSFQNRFDFGEGAKGLVIEPGNGDKANILGGFGFLEADFFWGGVFVEGPLGHGFTPFFPVVANVYFVFGNETIRYVLSRKKTEEKNLTPLTRDFELINAGGMRLEP